MKLAEVDWSVLRGAIVLFVVSLLIGGGLAYAGSYFGEQAEREHAAERRKLVSVRSEYQAVDDEQRMIETFLPEYEALEEHGIIGGERRLDWVETLRSVAQQLNLPSLRYELAPQIPYEAEFELPEGVYKVYVSEMRLDVGMLHEGDLPVLLRELNRSASGLFSVSECVFRRTAPDLRIEPKVENVNAACTLRWFTIKQPEEGEESA